MQYSPRDSRSIDTLMYVFVSIVFVAFLDGVLGGEGGGGGGNSLIKQYVFHYNCAWSNLMC